MASAATVSVGYVPPVPCKDLKKMECVSLMARLSSNTRVSAGGAALPTPASATAIRATYKYILAAGVALPLNLTY